MSSSPIRSGASRTKIERGAIVLGGGFRPHTAGCTLGLRRTVRHVCSWTSARDRQYLLTTRIPCHRTRMVGCGRFMTAAKDLLETRDALPGTVLMGKWRIVRPLAKGGMSTVYEAVHRNGRRVAVKVLHPTLAADARARSRFLRESSLANRVNHPNVVSVIDEDETPDGTVFLVMELLTGETLEERWTRQGRLLPVHEVLSIASDILRPLCAVHGVGIVHRDLKPSNVFLSSSGVKLLDFGVARLREVNPDESAIARSGSMLGTPAFMAPEQARGRWDEVDARTDIWAVGAVVFRSSQVASYTKVPLPTSCSSQRLRSRWCRSVESPRRFRPPVAEFIDRALRLDRQDRWPDAATMLQALGTIGSVEDGAEVEHAAIPDRVEPTTVPDETANGALNLAASRRFAARFRVPALIGFALTTGLLLLGSALVVHRSATAPVDANGSEPHAATTMTATPTPTPRRRSSTPTAFGWHEDVNARSGDAQVPNHRAAGHEATSTSLEPPATVQSVPRQRRHDPPSSRATRPSGIARRLRPRTMSSARERPAAARNLLGHPHRRQCARPTPVESSL